MKYKVNRKSTKKGAFVHSRTGLASLIGLRRSFMARFGKQGSTRNGRKTVLLENIEKDMEVRSDHVWVFLDAISAWKSISERADLQFKGGDKIFFTAVACSYKRANGSESVSFPQLRVTKIIHADGTSTFYLPDPDFVI